MNQQTLYNLADKYAVKDNEKVSLELFTSAIRSKAKKIIQEPEVNSLGLFFTRENIADVLIDLAGFRVFDLLRKDQYETWAMQPKNMKIVEKEKAEYRFDYYYTNRDQTDEPNFHGIISKSLDDMNMDIAEDIDMDYYARGCEIFYRNIDNVECFEAEIDRTFLIQQALETKAKSIALTTLRAYQRMLHS